MTVSAHHLPSLADELRLAKADIYQLCKHFVRHALVVFSHHFNTFLAAAVIGHVFNLYLCDVCDILLLLQLAR